MLQVLWECPLCIKRVSASFCLPNPASTVDVQSHSKLRWFLQSLSECLSYEDQ